MPQKDFYKILGVDRSATEVDIKKAFRRAARQYPPRSSEGRQKSSGSEIQRSRGSVRSARRQTKARAVRPVRLGGCGRRRRGRIRSRFRWVRFLRRRRAVRRRFRRHLRILLRRRRWSAAARSSSGRESGSAAESELHRRDFWHDCGIQIRSPAKVRALPRQRRRAPAAKLKLVRPATVMAK